jgi:hypothetical protein
MMDYQEKILNSLFIQVLYTCDRTCTYVVWDMYTWRKFNLNDIHISNITGYVQSDAFRECFALARVAWRFVWAMEILNFWRGLDWGNEVKNTRKRMYEIHWVKIWYDNKEEEKNLELLRKLYSKKLKRMYDRLWEIEKRIVPSYFI